MMIGRLNIAVIYGIIACVLLLLSSHVAAKTDEIVVAIEGGLEDIFSWKEAQQKLTKTLNTDKHSNLNSQ
jgi:hypothetical protein